MRLLLRSDDPAEGVLQHLLNIHNGDLRARRLRSFLPCWVCGTEEILRTLLLLVAACTADPLASRGSLET